jgi:uncharacterized membrane-anchored protein
MLVRSLALAVAVASLPVVASAQASSENPGDIQWLEGPAVGDLGTVAQIKIPDGFRFAGAQGVKRFMELTHNIPGDELGVIMPSEADWFLIFDFNPSGYVKDDEKNSIDPEALLSSIRSGTERANEERKRRGWETMTIVGWQSRPHFDDTTKNLTWGIRGKGGQGEVINHSVRLLGRGGVMQAELVLAPNDVNAAMPQLSALLGGFSFKPGQRYAEFRAGDKVAAYGLTALIAGGVGAAAMKSGVLAKLWKAIVIGLIAVVGVIRRFFAKLFGKSDEAAGKAQASSST